jgi:hypothetical protein
MLIMRSASLLPVSLSFEILTATVKPPLLKFLQIMTDIELSTFK